MVSVCLFWPLLANGSGGVGGELFCVVAEGQRDFDLAAIAEQR
jgi:hypothetical protein